VGTLGPTLRVTFSTDSPTNILRSSVGRFLGSVNHWAFVPRYTLTYLRTSLTLATGKKHKAIWKQQERRDSHYARLIVKSMGCIESRIKGAPECVLSPPPAICSRELSLFYWVHSFLFFYPFFTGQFFGIALTLYTPVVSRGHALPSHRGSVFPGIFGCCLQQERTHSPRYARPI
jgi:hypothetical protein